MINPPNHFLGNSILQRVASLAARDTIFGGVSERAVNAINAVKNKISVAVFYFSNRVRWGVAIETLALSKILELVFCERESQSSFAGVILIRSEESVKSALPVANAAICISERPMRTATAGLGGTLLESAEANFFLGSADAPTKSEVVVSILRVFSCEPKDGHAAVLLAKVFSQCGFTNHSPISVT